jgi:2-keto-4-pentenoate hydratase
MAATSLPDAVAQNISNAGVALGGPGVSVAQFDALRAVVTTVELDGRTVAEVSDGLPQHPLDVVAWMANHLAARGLQLHAGMVVLCGSHTPIQHPGAARAITVRMSGLGRVGVTLQQPPAPAPGHVQQGGA